MTTSVTAITSASDPTPSGGYVKVGEPSPVPDPTILDGLTDYDVDLRTELVPEKPGQLRIAIYSRDVLSLEQVLHFFTSMDLVIEDQRQAAFQRGGGPIGRLTEFRVSKGAFATGSDDHEAFDPAKVSAMLRAMWSGATVADRFNTLVLSTALDWREVALLRAYSRFVRQTLLPYGQQRIESILLRYPDFAQTLVELFRAQFDPARGADPYAPDRRIDETRQKLESMLDAVEGIDHDRVLRAYLQLVTATVRTTFYRPDCMTAEKPYLALKLRSRALDVLPEPKPVFEGFVYSPEMEGVHMRYGLIARGGLRWSDRLDDYRTELLGLVKAQAVKNAVIVPLGAKGCFVVKQPPVVGKDNTTASEQDRASLGRRCYRQFVSGLLDFTDNLSDDGKAVHPDGVLRRDEEDAYLVVAADKGTSTFSDVANAVAAEAGYWLGDAFASGGSVGYNHKKMGITARGVWVSVERHLAELGMGVGSQSIRTVGIGDMSGDVFGNGMLLNRNIVLVAAFDHRQIFVDPTPDNSSAWKERKRLFELPDSSWDDYDTSLISAGGGVFSRQSKSIPVSSEAWTALGLDESITSLSPNAMIQAILKAPVDLLYNGGVGTYIKASTEQNADIGDKANDGVRVDANQVRARVIGEGGNLGVTQHGRIEYARGGGRINTDAIDNAAGVDCSDHEVNIKILIATCGKDEERLEPAARATLLAGMADAVGASVLRNNHAQNRILGESRALADRLVTVHRRMVDDLEQRRGLDRALESLPSDDEFAQLASTGQALTSPELATLLAHTKLDLKRDLSDSDVFDDPVFDSTLRNYFPERLAHYDLDTHPLRRQILTTEVVNDIVSTGGLSFAFGLGEETGATADDVVRAFVVSSRVFSIHNLVSDINASDVCFSVKNKFLVEARRLLDRGARWFLEYRPQPLSISDEIDRIGVLVDRYRNNVTDLMHGKERDTVLQAQERYQGLGADGRVATALAEGLFWYSLLDIHELAEESTRAVTDVARLYFALSDYFDIDHWLLNVSGLPRDSRLSSLTRLALRNDLYDSLRLLTRAVLNYIGSDSSGKSAEEQIVGWAHTNRSTIERSQRRLNDIQGVETHDVSSLTLASRYIRSVVTGA